MNRGTKIRVLAFAIACVNQSISSIGAVDLGNSTANLIYNIISLACTIIAGAFALYYNNDFTEEACIGTGVTRQLKAEKKAGYVGDYFYAEDDEDIEDEEDPVEEDEDVDDDVPAVEEVGEVNE